MPATRKGKARLIVALLVFLAALLLGGRVRLDSDLQRLLPDTNPELNRAQVLLRRTLQRAVVDVEGSGEEAERFAERLRPHVAAVRSRVGEADFLPLVELLRERAALLIDESRYAAIERRIADAPAILARLARRLQEPDGAHLAARVAVDPLGITDLALEPLGGFLGTKLVDGYVTSEDGRHRLLFVDPGFSAHDTARTARFLEDIRAAASGLKVRHLGTHRSTLDNATQIERDAKLTAGAGVALVALLALLFFRRPAVALLALTPALFGAAVALGLYSLAFSSVAAAVAGFSAVLLGVTIDYAVHVLYARRAPVRAILMGATTTAAAFFGLRASSLPGLRETGLLGGLGVLAAALFAILVLPPRGRRAPLDLGPAVRALQSRAMRVAALVATPLLAVGAFFVAIEGDASTMSSLSPETRADEQAIRAVWGDAFRTTTLLVSGDDLESALQANDELAARLEGHRHASLAGLLPSRRTQEARLGAWRGFWGEDRVAGARAALRRAVAGTPFREDAFEPFFSWLVRRPPPMRPEDLPADIVRDRLLRTDDGYLVGTPVFDPIGEVEGATVVNRAALVARVARLVQSDTLRLGLVAFCVVGAIVFLWLGMLRPTVWVLAPLLLSCVWTFGVLGWLSIPITLANAIFVVFLFGLAVDYSIFLAHARIERMRTGEDRTAESDSAVLLCALTTCCGFGALALAGHPVLHSIGLTALVGILAAAVATQVFVPLFARGSADRSLAGLYRWQGVVVSRYAAAKARRDPIVRAAPDLCEGDVLVAGCGYGLVAARLALAGRRVRGIDFDARKVEVARHALRELDNAEFSCADLMTAELGRQGCVTAIDLLHYWPADVQKALLSRLVDALDGGGLLVFRDGCADAPGHDRVRRGEAFARRIGFTRAGDKFYFRTAEGWRTLMRECGLEVAAERSDLGLSSNLVLVCRKTS